MGWIDKGIETLRPFTLKMRLVFVALFLSCSGICNSVNLSVTEYKGTNLTLADSLIQEMVEFIEPSAKLKREQRKFVEQRIKSFPNRIIRRDTTRFFLHTAYAIAYNEFYKKDYKRGLKYSKNFSDILYPKLLLPFGRYSTVGFGASLSLNQKAKIKTKLKKDKNSWYVPININIPDSVKNRKYDCKRTSTEFIDSFLDDVPIDCDIATFGKLLTAYHAGGGKLQTLNYYRSFFQRCMDSRREDVLALVYDLWDVTEEDFVYDEQYCELVFKTEPVAIDLSWLEDYKNTHWLVGVDHTVNKVDSLIDIGENPSREILNLLSICYDRNRFGWLRQYCQKYESYIDEASLGTLYNYWALGSSFSGRYEEALEYYDKAIELSSNDIIRSVKRLNKGCTLGEMGRTSEAVRIFMEEAGTQQTPFEKFAWNDNLGYIYSFSDPDLALYYFNEAEKYLDSGLLYKDRKVRHFCRKARAYESNSFQRRIAIDRALELNGISKTFSKISDGMAYAELAVFLNSTFDFEEADRYFKLAFSCYNWLLPEDTRYTYLTREYARNLCDLGRPAEAVRILETQLTLQDSIMGTGSSESYRTIQILLTANCKAGIIPTSLYERYVGMSPLYWGKLGVYDDALARSCYLTTADDMSGAIAAIKECLSKDINSLQRIELTKRLEAIARRYNSREDYISTIHPLVEPLKRDVISSLLLLSGEERISVQTPIKSLIDGMIEKEDFADALSLSLFRKGLLMTTKRTVENKLATNHNTKKKFHELQTLRESLNYVVAFSDTVKIPTLTFKINQLNANFISL